MSTEPIEPAKNENKNNSKKRKNVMGEEDAKVDGSVAKMDKLKADVAMLKQYKAAIREGAHWLRSYREESLKRLADLAIVNDIKKPDNFCVEEMTARELSVTFTPRSGKARLVRRKYIDGKVVYSKSQSFTGPKYWVYEKNEGALYADAYAKAVAETTEKHPKVFNAHKVLQSRIDAAIDALRN